MARQIGLRLPRRRHAGGGSEWRLVAVAMRFDDRNAGGAAEDDCDTVAAGDTIAAAVAVAGVVSDGRDIDPRGNRFDVLNACLDRIFRSRGGCTWRFCRLKSSTWIPFRCSPR